MRFFINAPNTLVLRKETDRWRGIAYRLSNRGYSRTFRVRPINFKSGGNNLLRLRDNFDRGSALSFDNPASTNGPFVGNACRRCVTDMSHELQGRLAAIFGHAFDRNRRTKIFLCHDWAGRRDKNHDTQQYCERTFHPNHEKPSNG